MKRVLDENKNENINTVRQGRLLRTNQIEALNNVGLNAEAALDIASILFGTQCIAAVGNCANTNCLGCDIIDNRKTTAKKRESIDESKILGNVDCKEIYDGIRSFANCTGMGDIDTFCSILDVC